MEEQQQEEKLEKSYEISFIQKEEDLTSLRSLLSDQGAVVLEEQPFVKIRFAYEIGKESQGFLGVIRFEVDPQKIQTLSDSIRLHGNLVRFLIRRKDELAEVPEDDLEGKRRRRVRKPEIESLSNEALEKKIEEILQ